MKIGSDVYGPFASEPIVITGVPTGGIGQIGVRDGNRCTAIDQTGWMIDPATGCAPCPTPDGLMSIVNGRHTADVMWNVVAGGTGDYLLQIRELGTTAWTTITVSDTVRRVGSLSPCTAYEWRVATVCALEVSDYSAIQTFTTSCVRGNAADYAERSVFPNPASTNVTLYFESTSEADIQVVVYDALGKVRFADQAAASVTYQHNLDVSSLAAGIYMVQWNINGETFTDRFTKID